MIPHRQHVLLARGPFLLLSILAALLISQFQNFSVKTLVVGAALTLGCLLTIHDFLWVLRTHLRMSFQRALNDTVLDNVLRSIFDPETGWISCLVGMVMGNTLMYTLPMNPTQRVKLVQATFGVDEHKANVILHSPGGVKYALPENLQAWLGPPPTISSWDDKDDATCLTDSTGQELEPLQTSDDPETTAMSNRSTSQHQVANVELLVAETTTTSMDRQRESATANHDPQQRNIASLTTVPEAQLPVQVLANIIREMVGERIRHYAESVPNYAVLAVGASSMIGLLLHLSRNVRARQQVGAVVDSVTTGGLFTVASASIVALVAKRSLNLQHRQTTETRASNATLSLTSFLRFVDIRRWQVSLALLAMFLVRLRRKERLTGQSHRNSA